MLTKMKFKERIQWIHSKHETKRVFSPGFHLGYMMIANIFDKLQIPDIGGAVHVRVQVHIISM